MELPDVCWVRGVACVSFISMILSFSSLSVSHLSTVSVSCRDGLQGTHVILRASVTSGSCGEGYYDFHDLIMHPGADLILNWRMWGT